MRQKKPGRELIANAKKLCYRSFLSANVQTLKIEEADLDPYSSDEEAKYISLNKLMKIKVLAACSNQSKSTKKLSKELVKQILRCHIKKENNYIVPKNIKFGKWEPIKNTFLPAPAIVPATSQEVVMPDAEVIEVKKMVERKKYLRVVNILKEIVGATTITKRILDLGVNLTINELLISAPAIEKQFTKAISRDEAM